MPGQAFKQREAGDGACLLVREHRHEFLLIDRARAVRIHGLEYTVNHCMPVDGHLFLAAGSRPRYVHAGRSGQTLATRTRARTRPGRLCAPRSGDRWTHLPAKGSNNNNNN